MRISDYPGVGVALAWERALVVEDTLARRIVTVIADGRLTRARAAGLAAEALSWRSRRNPARPAGFRRVSPLMNTFGGQQRKGGGQCLDAHQGAC